MDIDDAAEGTRKGFDPRRILPSVLATRLDALRRDVQTVLANLAGHRPPPFTERKPLERHLVSSAGNLRSAITPRELRVARVVRETKDAVSLHLVDPAGGRIAFVPGQFFTLLVTLESGEELRRAYSVASAPDEDGAANEVVITIKRMPNGRASTHLVERSREGDVLRVLGPSGSFTVPATEDPASARRHLVLFAGGSGITPLASIARTLLAREPGSRVSLVYGNRGEADIIYRDALDALAAAHPDRFTLRHVLSDPPEGFTGRTGVLDASVVSAELDAIEGLDPSAAEFFVCGPEPMMVAAREALVARGALPAKIHEERFSSPARRASVELPRTPEPIDVHIGGATRRVVAMPGQTLLEAGLGAGLAMPFSCTLGGCGACKVKLVSGTVSSEEPNCLSPDERAAGFVLACVSRATSPASVEVP